MSIGSWLSGAVQTIGEKTGLSRPSVDVSGQKKAQDEITKRRLDFANQYANYQNRTAPQAANVNLAPAQQAQGPIGIPLQGANTQALGPANAATAAQVQGTSLNAAQTYDAARLAAARGVDARNIDENGRFGQGQAQNVGDLQAAARGEGPSASGMAADRMLAKGLAAQLALRSAARGSGVARAEQAAATNVDQLSSDIAAQAMEGKAREMAEARGQLTGALQGARGQDIQSQLANQQAGLEAGKFTAGAQNTMGLEQGRLEQQARSEGAQATNATNLAQGNINAEANRLGAQIGTDVSKFNTGAQNDMDLNRAQLGERNAEFNAGQGNTMQQFLAGLTNSTNQFNANQANATNMEQGRLNYQTGNENLLSQLDITKMDDQQKQALLNFLGLSQGQSVMAGKNISDTELSQNTAANDRFDKFIGLLSGKSASSAIGGGGGGTGASGGEAAAGAGDLSSWAALA